MTMNEKTEVVVAPIWSGWAVVSRESWNYINEQLDIISAILSCKTWGDYRRLNVSDEGFQELVYQETEVEPGEEPADEAPFHVDLSEYEDYDRDPWLQRATTDLFESIGDDDDDTFPWDLLYVADISTMVEHENIEAVIQALADRGIQVAKTAE
jgi:hypothetical protein